MKIGQIFVEELRQTLRRNGARDFTISDFSNHPNEAHMVATIKVTSNYLTASVKINKEIWCLRLDQTDGYYITSWQTVNLYVFEFDPAKVINAMVDWMILGWDRITRREFYEDFGPTLSVNVLVLNTPKLSGR